MEDMQIEDVNQLVNFYRQKAADLELQLLQSQLHLLQLQLSAERSMSNFEDTII